MKVSFLAHDLSYRTVNVLDRDRDRDRDHGTVTITLFKECHDTVRKIHVHAPRTKLSLY